MTTSIDRPRAVVFIDGQNLTRGLRNAFNMKRPTFDLPGLARSVCESQGWTLEQIRFYTGLPRQDIAPDLHGYWMRRLSQLGRQGVQTWKSRLKYAPEVDKCSECGHVRERLVGREKGVDVRIALDAVSLTAQDKLDVVVLFTQDQDFFEVVKEIRDIANAMAREVTVASVFPVGEERSSGEERTNRRGIRGTKQIPIRKEDIAPFR